MLGQPTLTLIATAYTFGQLHEPAAPQIALAGRSNVGKSSLMNALAGRKMLAKTSSTPGKTRSINYYAINDSACYLVDLPGYGYAKCSQQERNKWAELLQQYFTSSPGLKALGLLLDSRHEAQALDIQLAHYAESLGLLIIPILTKTDKSTKKELTACIRSWSVHLPLVELLQTSASKRKGIDTVWHTFLHLLN